ncbi:AMP-binding protein [Nocardioides albus]|uniref:Acyl-CoA synthetase (AMP-forming)/AMP-acid ligase II n=1 Tax=Nocardioides albus TaxID=1841 RepID=A0A7W5A412_9ACTN|nr:AMP-binding protein [Nocardioides albus]MBB3089000.1 acyl-CoA synthetase (AMP-forming)/AMP-acid ligase II [Nocardioides albus]GGU14902.1 acyl-CoA synthetase [Nocardioides albus]
MTTTVPPHVSKIEDYLARLRDLRSEIWPLEVPREVIYPLGQITITEHIRRWARVRGDHAAVVWHGRTVTYAELDRLSDRVAAHLAHRGLGPGDRVAVMMPNLPQFLVTFFGILKAGCVHVPINPMFRRLEVRYEIEDTGARLAFVLDDLIEEFAAGAEDTSITEVVATSVRDFLPESEPLPPGAQDGVPPAPGAVRFLDVIGRDDLPVPDDPGDLDALAALNYTGGTTGMPKGCEHTQRDMLYTAATGGVQGTAITQDSVFLLYLPVFWIAGEDGFLVPLTAGATLVLQYRYDADETARAIDRHQATSFVGTVDNVIEVMEAAQRLGTSLASLEQVTSMSFVTKLSAQVRERWAAESGSSAVLRESSYGMTEDHTMDTFTRGLEAIDLAGRPGFVGIPMPGTDVAIVDFLTEELMPIGEEGQIIVRAPSLMRGYYGKPEATADTLRDGWLFTGDSGLIDERGCLHYLGRRKEMLKVNGMSVFPSELEFQLSQHPDITAVGVVGQTDHSKGEVPLAFVELRDGVELSPDDIRDWSRQNMAPYKVPLVRVLPEIPLAPTGKVLKRELERLASSPSEG